MRTVLTSAPTAPKGSRSTLAVGYRVSYVSPRQGLGTGDDMTSEKAHISKVSEVFDRWASNGRADGMEAGHLPMARPAFEKLELTAGQRYLDIGCGNGYTVRWAAAIEDVDAIGIDVSESMIKLARERSTHLANTRFIHAPFPLPILKGRPSMPSSAWKYSTI